MSWGVENLVVRRSGRLALQHVAMSIKRAVVHAVVGGDGAGKSTLLKVLAGLDLGQEGEVWLPAPGRTGYVPQDGGVFADLTVAENLEFVADAYRLKSWRERADTLLARSGLDEFASRLAGRLSGGQRRKLAGSLALLPEPELLVLDEVTTGVDPVSRVGLWRLIAGAAAAGAAVVVATGYLDEAERAGALTLLHEGRVMASGSPASIVAAVPGVVTDRSQPTHPARAWRRGRGWREWSPEADAGGGQTPTLEDAAIIAELMERESGA